MQSWAIMMAQIGMRSTEGAVYQPSILTTNSGQIIEDPNEKKKFTMNVNTVWILFKK